jgi:hypothetical protein
MISGMAMPKGFKNWQEFFNKHIAECGDCGNYFQGDGYMSLYESSSLEDLQYHIDVPERLFKRLLADARCGNCGNSVSEMLELFVRPESEVVFERRTELANKRYGPRLSSFRDFLAVHPFLGAGHRTGRAILKAIEKISPITVDGRWFRGLRYVRGTVPKSIDFRAPADTVRWLSEGRFNHAGQSHWYLADSASTCVSELLDLDDGVVHVQEIEVSPCAKVLDVYSPDDAEPFGSGDDLTDMAVALILNDANLYARVERDVAWKPGYFLPRFVMDGAKAAGFAGIRYRSVRSFQGQNLVLFDRDWPAMFIGKPKRHKQENLREKFKGPDGQDLF